MPDENEYVSELWGVQIPTRYRSDEQRALAFAVGVLETEGKLPEDLKSLQGRLSRLKEQGSFEGHFPREEQIRWAYQAGRAKRFSGFQPRKTFEVYIPESDGGYTSTGTPCDRFMYELHRAPSQTLEKFAMNNPGIDLGIISDGFD